MENPALLYRDKGLQGVIPCAFQRSSEGYDFVARKLKEGDPIHVIWSGEFGTPYLDIESEEPFARAYTTEEEALVFCDALNMEQGFRAHPVLLEGEKGREGFFTTLQDLGLRGIRLDNACLIRLEDLAPAPLYDGFLDLDHPLRNATMNAALLLLCKKISVFEPCEAVFQYFFRLLQSGRVLVPVQLKRQTEGTVTQEDLRIPFFHAKEDDTRRIAVFTDSAFFDRSLIDSGEDAALVFNPGACNLNLDRETFHRLEAAVLQADGNRRREEEADGDDPMPDFLRNL